MRQDKPSRIAEMIVKDPAGAGEQLIDLVPQHWPLPRFPLATAVVNIIACGLEGLLARGATPSAASRDSPTGALIPQHAGMSP